MTISLGLCVQLAIASAIGAALFAASRWVRQRSFLCGAILAGGFLLRAVAMLLLFWTSYLDVPQLRAQHFGDGFWKLAIDAPIYYRSAVYAVDYGLGTIVAGSASPAFVKLLALWMHAIGVSPISGGYLNLALYVVLCVLIVAVFRPAGDWRVDLPCAVMLAAVSFSPVLVFYSSQPLKDMMFVFLIGVVCLAMRAFLPKLIADGGAARASIAGALGPVAAFLAALYVIAGIRAYYAVLAWSALGVVLLLFAWRQRWARLVRYVPVCAVLLSGAWVVYVAGAGLDYFNPYASVLNKALAYMPRRTPLTPLKTDLKDPNEPTKPMLIIADKLRTGFETTPGATNVTTAKPVPKATKPARPAPPAAAAPAPVAVSAPAVVVAPAAAAAPAVRGPAEDAAPSAISAPAAVSAPGGGISRRASALAVGLALILVPVSVLRSLSIVHFSGGRGLLVLTDADTLFMDLVIAAAVALCWRRRALIRERLPYVCFAAALGLVAGVLMAYIVTNFGTLFRLRLMAAVPLWLLPLALSRWSAGSVKPLEQNRCAG